MKKITKRIFLVFTLIALLNGCSQQGKSGFDSTVNEDKVTAVNTQAFVPADTSVDMVKAMTIGWNLGNTLDANSGKGIYSETSWGQPTTTKAMLKGIYDSGFKTVRIPVSWANHVSGENNTIDSAWLNRVQEIVDYAIDSELCVIINIHHDNVNESQLAYSKGYALSTNTELQNKSKKFIEDVWSQVAEHFKDYDNRLVFELLNEPRDVGGKNWGNEWWVGNSDAITANGIITAYEQAGLDAIRAAGGNNTTRFIMAPGYAGSTGCLYGYKLPSDTAQDRLILSVHAYSPYNFAMGIPGDVDFTAAHKSELSSLFNSLNNDYIKKGIGVVLGETGATNKGNTEARNEWAEYFFGEAYKKGIPCILWDNGAPQAAKDAGEKYGYYNRQKQVWYFPDMIKAMLNSVGIETEEDPGKSE